MNINNLPVTEQSNEITKNIDKSTSEEIICLFSKTDKQLFNYFYSDTSSNSLYDLKILEKIENLAKIIRTEHKNKFKIILSGCGTSGRLAYIASKNLNEFLKQDLCDYIIAGDDYALINSVEAVEDSAECGVDALKNHINNLDSFMFIGITCGLSAPFVAGQLDYCFNLDSNKALAIGLIGFNPAELARKNYFKLPNNGERMTTFYNLIDDNKNKPNFYLLNPIIGPEPITGSSRMKSGSATKIILDLIFLKFLYEDTDLKNLVFIYEDIIDTVIYKSIESTSHLANLINKSSNTLKSGNSISYLSLDPQIGILGCVDASECIPTFGANREDIRGFINYSKYNDTYWNELKQFNDTTQDSDIYKKKLSDHEKNFILLISEPDDDYSNKNNKNFYDLKPIYTNYKNYINNLIMKTPKNTLYSSQIFKNCLLFILIKISLNNISTSSFVQQGKIYENYMIDVKASNYKLYKRAIHIINLLSNNKFNQGSVQLSSNNNNNIKDSEICLLKSIYSTNDITNINLNEINKHIEIAKNEKFIVSKALIMMITKCNYEDAVNQLNNCLTVRTCIENIINN